MESIHVPHRVIGQEKELPLSDLLFFISVSRLVRLYPSVAINLSNAAWPSSVLLYTPASSKTSMNT